MKFSPIFIRKYVPVMVLSTIDGSWMVSMEISRHQNIEHWNKSHGQNRGKVIAASDIPLDIIATKVWHKNCQIYAKRVVLCH